MKLIFLVVLLLAVIVTQQNAFGRYQHTTAEVHNWVGTGDSNCDKLCKAKNFKVCGLLSKECCTIDCEKHWWGGQSCPDGSVVELQCSTLQSVTGKYWTGDTCNNGCTQAGGFVCGSTTKECCETGCDKGTFIQSCLDSKSKEYQCAT